MAVRKKAHLLFRSFGRKCLSFNRHSHGGVQTPARTLFMVLPEAVRRLCPPPPWQYHTQRITADPTLPPDGSSTSTGPGNFLCILFWGLLAGLPSFFSSPPVIDVSDALPHTYHGDGGPDGRRWSDGRGLSFLNSRRNVDPSFAIFPNKRLWNYILGAFTAFRKYVRNL